MSNIRALEFQDITAGRLKSVTHSSHMRALKMYNENLDSFELSFIGAPDKEQNRRSILFERLTEQQADAILATLRSEGIIR